MDKIKTNLEIKFYFFFTFRKFTVGVFVNQLIKKSSPSSKLWMGQICLLTLFRENKYSQNLCDCDKCLRYSVGCYIARFYIELFRHILSANIWLTLIQVQIFSVPNACLNNPCQHGTCHNSGSTYQCTCTTGYTGTNCDQGTNFILY